MVRDGPPRPGKIDGNAAYHASDMFSPVERSLGVRMRVTVPLLALAACLAPIGASAQSYTVQSYSSSFSSISFSGSLASLTSNDDGYATITPGFSFPFFGTQVSSSASIYVGSNGIIGIYDAITELTNSAIPSASSPNGFIAPFWDDLYNTSGSIFYEVQGSSGSYVLVIEYSGFGHYDARSDSISFQVRIHQSTGEIEIVYGPRSASSTVWTGTIGVEDSSGSSGAAYSCAFSASCSPSDVPNGTAVLFTPNGSPPPPEVDLEVSWVQTPPSTVNPGDTLNLSYDVVNNGFSSSSSSDISLYAGSSPTVTTSDIFLGWSTLSSISGGNFSSGTLSVSVPTSMSGTYYVAAIVDAFGSVIESDESNNTYSLGSFTVGSNPGGITVTTTSLFPATVGQFYDAQLTQTGASFPAWSVISGSPPPGVSLSSCGRFSGTPSAEGSYTFTVQASESGLSPGSALLRLDVSSGTGFRLTTTMLPPATVGVPYVGQVSATGGASPYAYQVVTGAPSWLRLSSDGSISGTPDAPGTHTLVISVFDSVSANISGSVVLEVVQPTAMSLVESIPSAVVGNAYSTQIVSGGVPPYNVTVTQGTLPNGFAFDAAGRLAGNPTSGGNWTIGIAVTDSNSPQGSVQGTLQLNVIERQSLEITVGNELIVYTNSDIDQALTVQGGVPPYRWSVVQGELMAGLSLDGESGHLIGRVMSTATATVTFGVTDSEGTYDDAVVIVRARVYRNTSGRGKSRDDGGCVCVGRENEGGSAALLGLIFAGAGLIGLRRRRA
jgi:hypothetical protein